MSATVIPFLPKEDADKALQLLSTELAWERRGQVPRMEYHVNRMNVPYTYGKGDFARTYQPQPTHPVLEAIWLRLQDECKTIFDVCFCNRYLNQSDHLGWHSDDSPEMDDGRPIVTVSLGVEREIWFRSRDRSVAGTNKIVLPHGSACIMPAGSQDTHQHRIPKASFQCGERISLVFRGYVKP